MTKRRVSSKEIAWVVAWALLVLALTSLPHALGWALSSPERVFGGSVTNVRDFNTYLAKMLQGARGAWLFQTPYTPEDHPGALVLTFYLVLGKLAALSGLSLPLTFHLARLACGFVLLLAVYGFVAYFTPFVAVRRVAFLLAALTGGLGWLPILGGRSEWLGSAPLDFLSPEAFTFLALYTLPQVALATATLLAAAVLTLAAIERRRWSLAALAGVLAFTLWATVPFYVVVLYAVLGSYGIALSLKNVRSQPRSLVLSPALSGVEGEAEGEAEWRPALKYLAVAALIPLPVVLYNAWVFTANPVFRVWAAQNRTPSPHPAHYLLAYGVLGVLAVGGGRYLWGRDDERGLLPLAWVAVVPFLLYLPFNLQRRLVAGFQVPLCLLASLGLARYALPALTRSRLTRFLIRWPRYTRPRLRRFAVTVLVLLLLPSNLLLILGGMGQAFGRQPPAFHERAELEALDWLATHTAPGDTVLSAFDSGNYIPARAGNRVFLGHGPETVHAEAKQRDVAAFFRATTPDGFRTGLLRRYHVAYVFHGPYERALGDFRPGRAPYLREVFANERYAIYQATVDD